MFVELYRAGLIYKDKRLVNWDPKLLTAISDLEVQQVETKGQLWHFKYPVEGLADTFITVATTRPETMLGDTAVAVHPDDERYRQPGRASNAILPLVGRRIPIVADEYSDPEKGTGAVKITPAHDFNDFEVGRRHNLPLVNVLDAEANLDLEGNEAFLRDVPSSADLEETLTYHGLDRFVVRKEIVERMEAAGLLAKTEPHLAHGAAWRPLRRRDRALPHRPVVRRRQDAGGARHRGGARRAARCSCRATGKKPISTGWRTSSLGASRASSGGVTRSRPGMASRSMTKACRSSAAAISSNPQSRPSSPRSQEQALAQARDYYGGAEIVIAAQ